MTAYALPSSTLSPAPPPRRASVLPGFRLTLGFALVYLSLLVLLPIATVFIRTAELSFSQLLAIATQPQTIAAFRVSFGSALIAAAINAVFGLIVAWVLVRYPFPGRKIVDAFVDLPFALPTAVAGITLAALYAPTGWLGQWFEPWGIQIAYTPLGIIVALTFVGLPFVVRTVEPILAELEPEIEEAAATLGATRLQTLLYILLPAIYPALLTGTALAFARAVGEYGSVIFIAGNMPMVSEIVPLLIMSQLEQNQYAHATALAMFMLLISFALLLVINILQWWMVQRGSRA